MSTSGSPLDKRRTLRVVLLVNLVVVAFAATGAQAIVYPTTDWQSWAYRIRKCESGNNYAAQNATSTASGAWQILDGTWGNFRGYSRAVYAPPEIQDERAIRIFQSGGTQPWAASYSCWKSGGGNFDGKQPPVWPIDHIIAGDWDANGSDTPGMVRSGNKWRLNNGFDSTTDVQFTYGPAFDFDKGQALVFNRPIVGKWTVDNIADRPGIVIGNQWHLNEGFDGVADIIFGFGSDDSKVLAGSWDLQTDWTDEPWVVNGNVWSLNDNFDSGGGLSFAYGNAYDRVVAGDWNFDGNDSPGVVRDNIWYINNDYDGSGAPGFAFPASASNAPLYRVVVGDWNTDGIDTPGLVRYYDTNNFNRWYLNDGFDSNRDREFTYNAGL